MKQAAYETVRLEKIVGGGQVLGQLADGRKVFVWGGLPGELVTVQITKKKSKYAEGIVTEVLEPSSERVEVSEPESYLSTSPWQIMSFDAEQRYKAQLIQEAFELHHVTLPGETEVFTDGRMFGYRNKIEFSWWWSNETNQLDLAFFRRGSHGKIPVSGSKLARDEINAAAVRTRDLLRSNGIEARSLKTLLIRTSQQGSIVAQLYVKDEDFAPFTQEELEQLGLSGFELIYSNPKSPASVITKRLQQWGNVVLSDTILGVPFSYAAEGFFQINLPVYERALKDMREWVEAEKPTVDLYSGVGTIGLTIGGKHVTLVEVNEHAVREMRQNIAALGREGEATAVLAASEQALDYISGEACIIVDPPRAGLHEDVVERLLIEASQRIIYLSCNPVTQARDVARLLKKYDILAHKGYNFFPRTPHIEHLVVLGRKV
ncbi:class I SAM-dependent RNA methyltransferase [Candidatus Saccharibacteria bacterium]|nr:class I SAM-dependent RNA methyltransferase [Candidatus Saccharibacteria bacterium]